MKNTIALYIRLSLEDEKVESMSIENQRILLNEYAARLPEWANAEIMEFVDNGYSGINFERPEVQRLLDMVREGKINCIIVKDLSRFGRDSIETGYFIERVFPVYHVRFIAVNDDFDSANYKGDTGGMDVAFKYLINEYYSRDMSIKSKTAKYAKMRRGEYQSVICPYGYQKGSNGRMEINEEVAGVVRRIFQWAADGASSGEISRRLYHESIPTPGEYRAQRGDSMFDISRVNGVWCTPTILRTIRDERYIGTYIIGKRAVTEIGGHHMRLKDESEWVKIPNHHPAIVDKEIFDRANAAIRRFSLPNKKPHDYLLRGKVFCGFCDHAMARTAKPIKYYCKHSQFIRSVPCYGLHIRADELEQAVFEIIRVQFQAVLGIDSDKDKLDVKTLHLAEYEKRLQALQDEKQRLYERFAFEEISRDDYMEQKAALDAELAISKNTYAAITAEAKAAQQNYEAKLQRQEIQREINEAGALTQALANVVIEKVYVFPGNRIEIAYKVKDLFAGESPQ